MSKQPSRHFLRWNVNEVLRLQREYELLEMSVADIAKLHNRSINAIVCKLVSEGFVDCWENARGYAQSELIQEAIKNGDLVMESCMDSDDESEASFDEDDSDDEDYNDDEDEEYSESLVQMNKRLQQRVEQLESVIASMRKVKTAPKRKPLRSYLY
jgi:hypothetical protein